MEAVNVKCGEGTRALMGRMGLKKACWEDGTCSAAAVRLSSFHPPPHPPTPLPRDVGGGELELKFWMP